MGRGRGDGDQNCSKSNEEVVKRSRVPIHGRQFMEKIGNVLGAKNAT